VAPPGSPTGAGAAVISWNFRLLELSLPGAKWPGNSLELLGKTTESDRHPNPTTNVNPSPYLVTVHYGSIAELSFS